MRAWRCSSPGTLADLAIEEIEVAPPDTGQVSIRISACGINFPDILMIEGRYQVKPPLPFVPGGEISGTIEALGDGVTSLKIGQRVMATIFFGGLCERAIVPQEIVVPIPDKMDLHTASVFQGGHTTAYFALKQRARLQAGETLLVLGASGGVGMAAMQLGRAMGANIIGAVSSPHKAEALRAMGFADLIDQSSQDIRDRISELTPSGVDVIFDPVGGELLEQASRSVARNSRVLIVGFASGQIASYQTNIALLKESAVIGVNYQSFFQNAPEEVRENFSELFEMFEQGDISPAIQQVFPFDQAPDAFQAMKSRSVTGKVLVDVQA